MLKRTFRFKAQNRLNHPASFTTPSLLVKFSSNQLPYSRFGFIISKKVDKRATVRNRVKRMIRSCIEASLPQIKSGYDMLYIIRKQAADQTRDQICQEVQTTLKQLK
jgi:ribonuclease P protein component